MTVKCLKRGRRICFKDKVPQKKNGKMRTPEEYDPLEGTILQKQIDIAKLNTPEEVYVPENDKHVETSINYVNTGKLSRPKSLGRRPRHGFFSLYYY